MMRSLIFAVLFVAAVHGFSLPSNCALSQCPAGSSCIVAPLTLTPSGILQIVKNLLKKPPVLPLVAYCQPQAKVGETCNVPVINEGNYYVIAPGCADGLHCDIPTYLSTTGQCKACPA